MVQPISPLKKNKNGTAHFFQITVTIMMTIIPKLKKKTSAETVFDIMSFITLEKGLMTYFAPSELEDHFKKGYTERMPCKI